ATVLFGKVDPSFAHFPFGFAGIEGNKLSRNQRSSDVPSEILSVFRSFKPYENGNPTLWALNTLCNTNKHRFLVTTEMMNEHAVITHIESDTFTYNSDDQIITIECGDGTSHSRHESNLPMNIVFLGIPKIEGKPAVRLLDQIFDVVGCVIQETQERCFYLGKLRLIPSSDGA
ncbi:MAG TPA: hypothetical protein VF410_06675, partial [Rhizomicrobium sp.]